MKKILLILLVAVGAFSCEDEQPASPAAVVSLNLKAAYNGDPLVLYQALDYPTGNQLRMQHFNFFISNITLLGEGSTPDHELAAVEFISFDENLSEAAAQIAQKRVYDEVPLGDYRGISVDFGVPAHLNNADAAQLGADNPLRKAFASHYWTDWNSFIFMKLEGIYDLNGDGVFNQSDQGFEHHPGMNEVLTSVTLDKPFTLQNGQTFDLNLTADLFDIYVKNGTPLDLSDPENKDTQELADLPLAIELMNHWAQALKF